MKTLQMILSGPQAVSQCDEKRTRQNCNFGAQLAYSWSAEEPAVHKITQKINMEMVQDTNILPRSSAPPLPRDISAVSVMSKLPALPPPFPFGILTGN